MAGAPRTPDGKIDMTGYDTTHDGSIDQKEYDHNGDGRIDEVRLDTNHDGRLDGAQSPATRGNGAPTSWARHLRPSRARRVLSGLDRRGRAQRQGHLLSSSGHDP